MRLDLHGLGKATFDAVARMRMFGMIDCLIACMRCIDNMSRQRQWAGRGPTSAPVLLLIFIVSTLLLGGSTSLAQNAPDMLRLFGGLMQGAIIEGAKAEWRKIRPHELVCIKSELQRKGTSTAALAQQGMFPTDGRLAGIRTGCASMPVSAPISTTAQPVIPITPQALSATPTYDCAKARSGSGRILCMDPAGAGADWRMSAVYWANLFSLPEAGRDAFKRSHEDWLQSVNRNCQLLSDQVSYPPQQTRCVLRAFRTRTDAYRLRLRGDALAESNLSPEQRAELQSALGALGIFDGDADGEFGPRTRAAIKRFQEQAGELQSEFLTPAQRARLVQAAHPASPAASAAGLAPSAKPADDVDVMASPLTAVEAASQCQSDDTDKRLVGCTAIINARGKGYSVALADAFDGRCRSYNNLGQYTRAVDDCKAAIGLNARHAYAYNNLAETLIGLGDIQGGLRAYTKSIEVKPTFIYSYLGRADTYVRLGDKESAKRDLDKALALDPRSQQAKDAIASLAIETPNLKEARVFLRDVQKFISEQTSAPSTISEIAAAAANLQIALTTFDERATLETKGRLNDLLTPIGGFTDFRAERDVERQRELARQFTLAAAKAEQHVYFITEFLRQNLGYQKTKTLLDLKERLEGSLKPQTIDEAAVTRLDKATATLEGFISDNSLSADYDRLIAARSTPTPKPPISTPTVEQLQTEKNSIALVGADDDMVLLFNASRSAPSIAKDIAGKFAFFSGTASLCFAQGAMDEGHVWFLERMLRDQGAKDVKIDRSPCDVSQLLTAIDVVVFQRGELRKQRPEYVIGLLDLIQNDSLREYRTITEAAYNADVQNIRARSLRIARDVESNETLTGFGILTVSDAAIPACVIAADHVTQRGLEELLQRNKDLISRQLRFEWTSVEATLDSAFLSLSKEQCGYAVANAAGLRTLMLALRRDGKKYEFAPLWFPTEEVIAAGTEAVVTEREKIERQEEDAQIREAIRRQQQAQKDAITEKLRNQNGAQARGLRDRIQKLTKDAADKPLSDKVKDATDKSLPDKPRRAIETQKQFPSFTAWLNKRFDAQWETTEVTSDIADYGTVQWKGRSLEGIVVRTQIQQKNAIMGARQTDCFTFGLVNDDEFNVERDFFDVGCSNDRNVIADWKARRQFNSLWNAE
jgi:tetratricopeptide (TPR) repeat protein